MRARLLIAGWVLLAASGACSRTRGADDRPGRGPGPGPRLADGGSLSCAEPCDDGLFCNGEERCDPDSGACVQAMRERCDDGDECTIDRCDEAADRCQQTPLPRDEDGDGWDACDGDCDDGDPDIHPGASELCDGTDSDCDGESDEGLTSPCGDCRPGCRLLHLPEPGEPWRPTADNSDAVSMEGDAGRLGPLVLDSSQSRRFDAWIASSADGKVTKLDTRTGRQLARYDSVLRDGSNGALPADWACDRTAFEDAEANCPSRTAVDAQGAVYVANRAFGHQGTVTKIAGFEEDCVDRDGDGVIATSRDLDGNGQIERFAEGEFLGQDDECLLWTVDAGGDDGVPRALAVDADGHVWVGLFREQRVLELDPADGSLLRSVSVAGFRPYGAAIDSRGGLWLTQGLSGSILRIDTERATAGSALQAPAPEDGCPSSYGIAIDARDRVWIAGFSCPYAFGYDSTAARWTSVPLPDAGVTRGIAADDRGRIFVASSHAFITLTLDPVFGYLETSDPIARLTVFDADDGGGMQTFGTTEHPLPGRGSIGVGLDDQGRAWLINQDSSSATRVDVDSGQSDHFGAGDLPYTYSDFTGFALRRITAPSGYIRHVFEGCERGPSEWEELRVDADVPDGARVEVRVRSAAARDELAAEAWSEPRGGQSQPLSEVARLRFLEIEARLSSGDRRSSPALHRITVRLHCPR